MQNIRSKERVNSVMHFAEQISLTSCYNRNSYFYRYIFKRIKTNNVNTLHIVTQKHNVKRKHYWYTVLLYMFLITPICVIFFTIYISCEDSLLKKSPQKFTLKWLFTNI